MADKKIRVAIVGVGNCASSLVQGIHYYRNAKDDEFVPGVMHVRFGGYHIRDIEVVAAFDVNENKVGEDVAEAIYAEPNNTAVFAQVPKLGVKVSRGPRLDGVNKYTAELVPVDDKQKPVDVVKVLKDAKVDAVINYLPVGSQEATEFYAQAAIVIKAHRSGELLADDEAGPSRDCSGRESREKKSDSNHQQPSIYPKGASAGMGRERAEMRKISAVIAVLLIERIPSRGY